MPPKSWKAQKLVHSLEGACEWKRMFFERHRFEDVNALVMSAAAGDMALRYVQAYLDLAHRKRRRHTVTDLYHGLNNSLAPRWVPVALSGLWILYSTERNMWKSANVEDVTEFAQSTRTQRAALAGLGWVTRRPVALSKRAAKLRDAALKDAAGITYVLWMDNYNKFRYSRNPNEDRDACVNATVMSILPMPTADRSQWTGWPTLAVLLEKAAALAAYMVQHRKGFADRFRTLYRKGLAYEHVRVPLDLRRYGVRTLGWQPYCLHDADIKGTVGLPPGHILHHMSQNLIRIGLTAVGNTLLQQFEWFFASFCLLKGRMNHTSSTKCDMPPTGPFGSSEHPAADVGHLRDSDGCEHLLEDAQGAVLHDVCGAQHAGCLA